MTHAPPIVSLGWSSRWTPWWSTLICVVLAAAASVLSVQLRQHVPITPYGGDVDDLLFVRGAAAAGIPPGRYAIGDSVMLGAKDELSGRGIRVNAVVSRQFRDAVPLVERLRAAGRLRRKIVIHLGNNGILIQAADCNRISEVAGAHRTVYLVNLKIPRSYRRIQNGRLAACAQRRANTLLIDWFGYSRYHPSWFATDGYHLSSIGQTKFAALIAARTA